MHEAWGLVCSPLAVHRNFRAHCPASMSSCQSSAWAVSSPADQGRVQPQPLLLCIFRPQSINAAAAPPSHPPHWVKWQRQHSPAGLQSSMKARTPGRPSTDSSHDTAQTGVQPCCRTSSGSTPGCVQSFLGLPFYSIRQNRLLPLKAHASLNQLVCKVSPTTSKEGCKA